MKKPRAEKLFDRGPERAHGSSGRGSPGTGFWQSHRPRTEPQPARRAVRTLTTPAGSEKIPVSLADPRAAATRADRVADRAAHRAAARFAVPRVSPGHRPYHRGSLDKEPAKAASIALAAILAASADAPRIADRRYVARRARRGHRRWTSSHVAHVSGQSTVLCIPVDFVSALMKSDSARPQREHGLFP